MKKQFFFLAFVFVFIFGGCADKVLVNGTKPALVDRASQTKKVAVLKFESDDVGLGAKIESAMYQTKINGTPYFTIISKKNRDDIINEQKFQYSGLANKENGVEIGELLGAQALITGKVNHATFQTNRYYDVRVQCLDKKCEQKREYHVPCINGNYSLSASISMIDVAKGDVIFTDNYSQNTTYSKCSDEGGGLPSKSTVMDKFANNIVSKFMPNIAPTQVSYYLEVLDDPEIDYTDEQEKMLENGIEYIKMGRLDRSEELFSKLLTSTNDKCYVASYNLAVVKETKGEYEYAKQLYTLSDTLSPEPNETISKAILRIDRLLIEQKSLQSQLENK